MNREVGIFRRATDGMEITSFLDPPVPKPDESLLGWVTRVADDHAYRSISRALKKAGFANPRPESLPMFGRTACERLSFLLKTSTAEIEARLLRRRAREYRAGSNRILRFADQKNLPGDHSQKSLASSPICITASSGDVGD